MSVGACGGDDNTVYVYIEAGGPETSTREGSVPVFVDDGGDETTCHPQPVPARVFHAAPGRYQGKCTAADITKVMAACVDRTATSTACDKAKVEQKDCAACLIGNPDDAVGHPFVVYRKDLRPIRNTSICMAAFSGEGQKQTDCTAAYGLLTTCAIKACIDVCPLTTDQEANDFLKCYEDSLTTSCKTVGLEVDSDACQKAYNDPQKYGFCFPADPENPPPTLAADYAAFLCGFNPDGGGPDAGKDSGTDAGQDAGTDSGTDSGTPTDGGSKDGGDGGDGG